jgi:hypothetical protein
MRLINRLGDAVDRQGGVDMSTRTILNGKCRSGDRATKVDKLFLALGHIPTASKGLASSSISLTPSSPTLSAASSPEPWPAGIINAAQRTAGYWVNTQVFGWPRLTYASAIDNPGASVSSLCLQSQCQSTLKATSGLSAVSIRSLTLLLGMAPARHSPYAASG